MMTEPTRPPICYDCKHFMTGPFEAKHESGSCGHPKLSGFSPVYGRSVQYAAKVRADAVGDCGPDGKLFEAAPVAKNDDIGPLGYVFGLGAIGVISAFCIAVVGLFGYVGVMAVAQWWWS